MRRDETFTYECPRCDAFMVSGHIRKTNMFLMCKDCQEVVDRILGRWIDSDPDPNFDMTGEDMANMLSVPRDVVYARVSRLRRSKCQSSPTMMSS